MAFDNDSQFRFEPLEIQPYVSHIMPVDNTTVTDSQKTMEDNYRPFLTPARRNSIGRQEVILKIHYRRIGLRVTTCKTAAWSAKLIP